MSNRILIVGGGGFIGSHLADTLLADGHEVRVLDNLDPQVHGDNAVRPDYLDDGVELHIGDVRDCRAVERALRNIDIVYHLAAAVGVGQSMYEIARYSSINSQGTAILLEALIRCPVDRLIVASSMSIYGEGLYKNSAGKLVANVRRNSASIAAHQWEPADDDGHPLTPVPTSESKSPDPSSVYALLKYHQEQICLCVGAAYKIPVVALRFFNAFGTRQSLSNPYTGVMAIFAARLLNGKPPLVYEDGLQRRDFVSVHDLARACHLAMSSPNAPGLVLNIGSGEPCAIKELAERMARVLGRPDLRPVMTEKYRVGDIRHCFAGVKRARKVLDYAPRVSFDEGLAEFAEWLGGQAALDHVAEAGAELSYRGLEL